MVNSFSLANHGISVHEVLRNPSPAHLYELALQREKGSAITSSGALVALSGAKTGRSPKDKRIMDHPDSTNDVWWGPVNIKLTEQVPMANLFLSLTDRLGIKAERFGDSTGRMKELT